MASLPVASIAATICEGGAVPTTDTNCESRSALTELIPGTSYSDVETLLIQPSQLSGTAKTVYRLVSHVWKTSAMTVHTSNDGITPGIVQSFVQVFSEDTRQPSLLDLKRILSLYHCPILRKSH